MRDFFGCYLLLSLAPQAKGRTYIGFTVNPRRRVRQHNGLITAGAWKTSRGRPWEMTLVLYGFPTKIQALQFEWAWQHPLRSVIVRPIAQALGSKKLQGVRGKILLMLSMLHESPWRHFPLTLQYLHPKYAAMVKETVVSAPSHIRVLTAPMEDLPRALDDLDDEEDEEDDDQDGQEEPREGCGDGGRRPITAGNGSCKNEPDADGSTCSGDVDSGSGSGDESSNGEPVEVFRTDQQDPYYDSLHGTLRGSCRQRTNGAAATGATVTGKTTKGAAAVGGGSSISRLPCQICQIVIQRHILVCSACGVAFHLDCLAARWSATEAGFASGRFGGAPEQGHCPACSTLHSWMAMLRGMQTIGWGNKPRGRRGRKAKKTTEPGDAPVGRRRPKGKDTNGEVAAVALDLSVPKVPKRSAKRKAAPANTAAEGPQIQLQAGETVPLMEDAAARCGDLREAQEGQQQLSQKQEESMPATVHRQEPRGAKASRSAKSRRPKVEVMDAAAGSLGADAGTGNPIARPLQAQGGCEGLRVAAQVGRARQGLEQPRNRNQQPFAQQAQRPAVLDQAAEAGSGLMSHLGLGIGTLDGEDEEVCWGTASQQLVESPTKRQRRVRQLPEASVQEASKACLPCSQLPLPNTHMGERPCTRMAHDAQGTEPSPLPLWQRLRVRAAAPATAVISCSSRLGVEAADGKRPGVVLATVSALGQRRVVALARDSAGRPIKSEGSPMERRRFTEEECSGSVEEVEVEAKGGSDLELPQCQRKIVSGWCSVRGVGKRDQDSISELRQATSVVPSSSPQRQRGPREQPNLLTEEDSPGCSPAPEQQLPDVVILGTTSESTEEEELDRGLEFWASLYAGKPCGQSSPRTRQTCDAALSVEAGDASPGVYSRATRHPPFPIDIHSPGGPENAVATSGSGQPVTDHPAFGSPILSCPGSGGRTQEGGVSVPGSAGGSAYSSLAALLSQLHCCRSTSPQPEHRLGDPTDGLDCSDPSRSAPLVTSTAVTIPHPWVGQPVQTEERGEQTGNPVARSPRHRQQQRNPLRGKAVVSCTAAGHVCWDDRVSRQEPVREVVRPRNEKQAVVVDLCTPMPLRSRLARRVAMTQATGAAGPCPGVSRVAGQAEHAAGKRLRSPKPLLGLPGFGTRTSGDGICSSGDVSDGRPGQCALSVAPGVVMPGDNSASQDARAVAQPAVEELMGTFMHAHDAGHEGATSGGWSASPWPLRQRRESQVRAVILEGSVELQGRVEDLDGGSDTALTVRPELLGATSGLGVGNRIRVGEGRSSGTGAGESEAIKVQAQQQDTVHVAAIGSTGESPGLNLDDAEAGHDVIVID